MAAHLVYTGTVVEGMRVAAVIHEARNITGGVRRLEELSLHVHLVELHREDRSAAASAKSEVTSQDQRGPTGTYDQVLLLVADLHCVYGVGGEGTAGVPVTLQKKQECEWNAEDEGSEGAGELQFLRTAVGVVPRSCGPQRPEGRPTCPSPGARSPCRGTLSAAFGVSPGPTPSPELLQTQTKSAKP